MKARLFLVFVFVVSQAFLTGGVTAQGEAPPSTSKVENSAAPGMLLLYDDFNGSAFDGALWSFSGESFYQAMQIGGSLVFTNTTAPTSGGADLNIRRIARRSLQQVQQFEARLKVSSDHTGGYAFVKIQIFSDDIAGHGWWTQCRLGAFSGGGTPQFICDVFTVSGSTFTFEYGTTPVSLSYNTWYTARIEANPATAQLNFYLDGASVGSHTPNDATALILAANLQPRVGVWNDSASTYATRYVDDVQITDGAGPSGQPGLSFRYVQTFGVTETPYFSDTVHINRPIGLFMDATNNLYVVEEQGYRLLRYNPSGSATLAIGKAGVCYTDDYVFCTPHDVALDGSGNIWVADDNRIAQYDTNGLFLQQFPTTDPWMSGSDNSRFNQVFGVAFDGGNHLFVSDSNNHRIQVFDLSGGSPVYSTTIGTAGTPGSGANQFNTPYRIVVDSSNRLYVMDRGNNRVQRCAFAGTWNCTTFDSGLNEPEGIALDTSGNVYIADKANGRIRRCTSTGVCSDFVTGLQYWAHDLAVDASGNVYAAVPYGSMVLKYNSSGTLIGTFAGVEQVPYLTDNLHYYHSRVAVDSADNLIVIEENGQRLVKLNPSGIVLGSVGVPGIDANDNSHFNYPHGVAAGPNDNVYVADNYRVQIFTSNLTYSATLGTGFGTGNYEFGWASGIAVDNNGNIYVSDGGNQRVQVYNSNRQYVATLGVTGVVGSDNGHFNYPIGIEVDSAGNIYVADSGNCRVQKFNSSRIYQMTFGTTGSCTESFSDVSAEDVTVDARGRVYISGWDNRVQVFDSAGAYLTTIGGIWGTNTSQFRGALGVAVDSAGNVYVADYRNGRIQKFTSGVPGWQQSNLNGFGDPRNGAVNTIGVFNGQMYAGGSNTSGGQIWRTADGQNWTAVNTNGFGDPNNGPSSFAVFNNTLYLGTSNTVVGAGIYTTTNGLNWTNVITGGFGMTSTTEVINMTVFNNQLYAATLDSTAGGQIWRTPDGLNWTNVVTNNFGSGITFWWSFEQFNGQLYAGLGVAGGGALYRTSDGTTWNPVTTDGFGDADNRAVHGLAVFNNQLYAATRNFTTGAQVWRSSTGDLGSWAKVATDGFGDINNSRGFGLIVAGNALYLTITNLATGDEVWRTTNGTTWEKAAGGGWGDANNLFSDYSDKAAVVFNNRLYMGTINDANGGEIWQYVGYPVYLPLIRK